MPPELLNCIPDFHWPRTMFVSALLGAGTSVPWPAGVGGGEIPPCACAGHRSLSWSPSWSRGCRALVQDLPSLWRLHGLRKGSPCLEGRGWPGSSRLIATPEPLSRVS